MEFRKNMTKFLVRTIIFSFAVLSVGHSVHAQSSISTFGLWDGSQGVGSFGGPNVGSYRYGQSITVGADTVLTDFTFWTKEDPNGGNVSATAKVYEWDSANYQLIGPSMFTSNSYLLGTSSTFVATTVHTNGINLVSGRDYILMFETDENQTTGAYFGQVYADVLPGSFLAKFNPSNNWSAPFNSELAFTANFTSSNPGNNAVPEPSEWAAMGLLGTGLLGLVVRGRKKNLAN